MNPEQIELEHNPVSPSTVTLNTASTDQLGAVFEVNEDVNLGEGTQPLLLRWRSVLHSVELKTGFFNTKKTEKIILDKISGSARPGELVSIMGPSGGGKTSLLNVLAGRITPKEGKVTLNNQPLPKSFNRLSAYVMQDDLLPATLTPRELLTFAANCRLSNLSKEQRTARVEQLIRLLGLSMAANTLVGDESIKGISGGERKRTSIGYELITNPSLIFLDEPTSGLDSFTALSLLDTLKQLAKSGRTVICTIHQPSSEIFELFDKLILLARGKMVYSGLAKDSMNYFDTIGFPCPAYSNPADYYMEILHFNQAEDLERIKQISDAFETNLQPKLLENEKQDEASDEQQVIEKPEKRVGYFKELFLLLGRTWKMVVRNPVTLRARLGQTISIALIAGAVFVPLGTNQTSIQGRNGALFFMVMSQSLNAMMSSVLTMPIERRLLVRERQSAMYRVSSFFFSKTAVEVLMGIFIPLLFSSIEYWFIGFSNTAKQFFTFYGILVLLVFAAGSMGILIGSAVPNPQVAVTLAPVVLLPLMLFGGLFVNLDTVGAWFSWIKWISLFKWGFEALLINEYTGLQLTCDPSEYIIHGTQKICPITHGEQVLTQLGLYFNVVWKPALILLGMGIGFRIIALLFLQFQTNRATKKI